MLKGPKGQKRQTDVIANAVHIMRIATGEAKEELRSSTRRSRGGRARAKALTKTERSEIARVAAAARWKKS